MRIFISVLIPLMLMPGTAVIGGNAQARPKLVLRDDIESVVITERPPSDARIDVKLKLELINEGPTPVLLLKENPLLEERYPKQLEYEITKTSDTTADNRVAWQFAGESDDTSPRWTTLRNALDQNAPPLDKIRIIEPNESYSFEDRTDIFFSSAIVSQTGKLGKDQAAF
ncbi:MAG TPA: hypothetical protein VJX67_19505 [Blastocatellia bacterium]|nr:hypothetical protein [Blastocatellia bacterium]